MIGSQVRVLLSIACVFFPTVCTEELLIDFCELIGSHSGENMALAVWDTLELYGLKGKVRSQSIVISRMRLTITILVGACYQLR